jgi:hypothetical protein
MKTTYVEVMDTSGKNSILELNYGVHNIKKKITRYRYELEVALDDKVYLEMYYNHQPWSVAVDETPSKIKTHEL